MPELHDSLTCECRVLLDSPPARRGIAAALREIQAGTDAGRYGPRDIGQAR